MARSNSSSVRRMPSQPVSTGVPKRARSVYSWNGNCTCVFFLLFMLRLRCLSEAN